MVPLFRCSNMKEAISFYTQILDFELFEPGASANDVVVLLKNGDAELMLSAIDGTPGVATNIWVENVDGLFEKYTARGLDQSHRTESPVHLGPTNQTWGTREWYITDADGNTLRLVQAG